MGYSVDVGSVEDTDARVSPILHAHAHAEEQSGHGAHQEDHAKDDARNCGAPGTNTHTKLSRFTGPKCLYAHRFTITRKGCKAVLPTTEEPSRACAAVLNQRSRRCQRSDGVPGTLKDSWCEN